MGFGVSGMCSMIGGMVECLLFYKAGSHAGNHRHSSIKLILRSNRGVEKVLDDLLLSEGL